MSNPLSKIGAIVVVTSWVGLSAHGQSTIHYQLTQDSWFAPVSGIASPLSGSFERVTAPVYYTPEGGAPISLGYSVQLAQVSWRSEGWMFKSTANESCTAFILEKKGDSGGSTFQFGGCNLNVFENTANSTHEESYLAPVDNETFRGLWTHDLPVNIQFLVKDSNNSVLGTMSISAVPVPEPGLPLYCISAMLTAAWLRSPRRSTAP